MQTLTVAALQDTLTWHDPAANRARIDDRLQDLPDVDLIVLAEMFSTGFTMRPEQCAEAMDGPTVAWMRKTAQRHDAMVAGSLVIEDKGAYYNRFVLMPPDGEPVCYDKRHRFALAGEHKHYAAGDKRVLLNFRGWRIAPFVCYDLRFPVWCRRPGDCDLMLFVANWPTPRRLAWTTLLRARAIENQCYLVGVNRIGRDAKDHHYSGDSVILDHMGAELAAAGEASTMLIATLSLDTLAQDRDRLPFYRDADSFELN